MAIKYGIAMRTNRSRRLRYNQCYNYKLYPSFGRIILIQYFIDSAQQNWFDHDFNYHNQTPATFSNTTETVKYYKSKQ